MRSHLAELVKLFILVNLVVMALFTIPTHAPDHNTAHARDQQVNSDFVTVTDARSINQPQDGY